MRIATWNVNSLRVRLPHVCDWLRAVQPDVLAMLETKLDHVALSTALRAGCSACRIDKAPRRLERPSDHAPVIAELA